MKKTILTVAVGVSALALAAPAALADNGTGTTTGNGTGATCQGQTPPPVDTSQIQADIAKLDTDVQTRHSDLDADIQALTADAQQGALVDTLKSDRQKALSDFQTNESVVKQDRSQLQSDAKVLLQSVAKGCGARKAAHDQLVSLRTSAAQSLQQELVQFKQENEQLRDAAKAAVQQDRHQHHQTTTTTGG
jgi:hypothetical protein